MSAASYVCKGQGFLVCYVYVSSSVRVRVFVCDVSWFLFWPLVVGWQVAKVACLFALSTVGCAGRYLRANGCAFLCVDGVYVAYGLGFGA